MFIVPIVLLAVLVAVALGANAMKKKGRMTELGYQTVISVSSIAVTIAALAVLVVRMRAR
ncbi:MAG TPA: hypothetical protein VFT29_15845 [Gemmatimonadaceae bacterium]|nr:hypothetical protein [Gemmatimonadaceae bacterium]